MGRFNPSSSLRFLLGFLAIGSSSPFVGLAPWSRLFTGAGVGGRSIPLRRTVRRASVPSLDPCQLTASTTRSIVSASYAPAGIFVLVLNERSPPS